MPGHVIWQYMTQPERSIWGTGTWRGRKRLSELLQEEQFRNMREDTEWVIAAYLDRKRLAARMKKEGLNMCQALDELMEDKKHEGKQEGKQEERELIVCRMMQEGLELSLISKITGCSEEELTAAADGSILF